MKTEQKAFFSSLFDAAVAAADPARLMKDFLPERPRGRTIVVGAGKGTALMARAFEQAWPHPLEGVIVTRYGFGVPLERIELLEAAHPVPDAAGLAGARRLLDAVRGLTSDDLVVALISGGGSALLPCPLDGLSLEDEIAVNRALLGSGAPISAMNTIRKHVSRIKGGRLAAAACPAKVVTLVVSDIPGDDPALVSSGPTVPDAQGREQALALIETYRIKLPEAAMRMIASAAATAPDPRDQMFAQNEVHVIASARLSLEAAAQKAGEAGIGATILSDAIEGEARHVGLVHAAIAREVALRDRPFRKPVLLLSGGETTVTLAGKGKGGRNTEFLLSLALAIEGIANISAFAADTDGIDGSENNAGAFADHSTATRLRATGNDPRAMLAENDAWTAFSVLGDLFEPGPTGTNVNDLRAVLIEPA